MLEAGHGSIVNVASIVGATVGMPWRAPYASSKAGVVGLTRTLAVEWAGRGVRVNALLPGPVRTPMVAVAIAQGVVDPQGVVDHTPAGRWALPDGHRGRRPAALLARGGFMTARRSSSTAATRRSAPRMRRRAGSRDR